MSFRMSCEFPLTTTEHLKEKGNGNIKTTTTRFHVSVCVTRSEKGGDKEKLENYIILFEISVMRVA